MSTRHPAAQTLR